MDLEAKVRKTVRKYSMFRHGDRVLVAVSGGPDSVALLGLLVDLKKELDLGLEVAHLEHGIRGDEAREDALFVSRLAERFSLPFHLRQLDLPGIRRAKGGGNLEDLARNERYQFFAELAGERGIHKLATAHTRDDRTETLLMWLLRGSGGRGLGAIPPMRRLGYKTGNLWLVRPLIEASRQEITGYLAANALSYRTDHTNLDRERLRNWIRLELLPRLRARLDLNLDERLARTADLVRDDEALLDMITRERLGRATRAGELVGSAVVGEHKAIQRRLIRLWLEQAKGDLRAVGFDHVDAILDFITRGPPQGRLSIPGGWEIVKEYDALRLEGKRGQPRQVRYSYELPPEGELDIPEAGMRLKTSRHAARLCARPRGDWEAVFDLARLPEKLTVRNFRAGDRFRPLGMHGRKKVKDLFIEKRVPRSLRSTLPLLAAGEEILWIPRCGRSSVAAVGPATPEVLRVELVLGQDQAQFWQY